MTGARVLVVEDDPVIRNEVAGLLVAEGWAVDAVASATAARSALAGTIYAAVIIDLTLADGSGLALIVAAKQSSAAGAAQPAPAAPAAAVPVPAVIVLSATIDLLLRSRCLELGADDFVGKPFQPRELVRRVQRAVNRNTTPG